MNFCKKSAVGLAKKLERLSGVSTRLVYLTGKSLFPIHPKHFLTQEQVWITNQLKPTDILLDLGCGNGAQTLKIAPFVRKIIAVERAAESLTVARNLAEKNRIKNVFFQTGDLEKSLPMTDCSFDGVLLLDVLEHLENRDQILDEIKRVLKSGGRLFLAVPNRETSWKNLQREAGLNSTSDPDHKIEYNEKEIGDVLAAGFKIISFQPVVYDTWLAPLIDIMGGFSLRIYQKLARWKKETARKNPAESVGWRIVCVKI